MRADVQKGRVLLFLYVMRLSTQCGRHTYVRVVFYYQVYGVSHSLRSKGTQQQAKNRALSASSPPQNHRPTLRHRSRLCIFCLHFIPFLRTIPNPIKSTPPLDVTRMQENPDQQQFVVGCYSPFMQLAEHRTELLTQKTSA